MTAHTRAMLGMFPPALSVAAPAIAPECVCPGSADLVAVMLTVPDSRIVDFPAAATFTAAPHSFYR